MVQTVLGVIAASRLGHCQPHEHIIVRPGPATEENPSLLIDDEDKSFHELLAYQKAGGSSIIDCQPGGAGRDASALRRLSEKSGVNIVAVTGYHLPAFYRKEHSLFASEEEALCEGFLAELTQGVSDHDGWPPVRAGAVKAAIGAEGATGRFAVWLRAAARAAFAAGVPLILHTERGAGAVEAVKLCERVGLAPRRVLVCHADRQATDFSVHETIAATGAMLEYDTIGRSKYHDDDSEIRLIAHMLNRGYREQILLSLDTTQDRLKSYGGAPGLCYLLEAFLPSLRGFGLSREDVDVLTVKNPARIFES